MASATDVDPGALQSASSLVLLQAGSRLATFILNQALVRLSSPASYGVAAIQFELVSSSILFLAREGIRSAVIRASSDNKSEALVNVTRLPLLLGIPVSLVVLTLYYTLTSAATINAPNFTPALLAYVVAAFLELSVEPAHLAILRTRGVGVRVKSEGMGVAARSFTTFTALFILSRVPIWRDSLELAAFSVGQLAYAIAVFSVYRVTPEWTTWRLQPVGNKDGKKEYFDHDALRLSGDMTAQSVVKHFLTEGDKFLLSVFAPLKEQGGYALASNYGSLVARIIFQPLEETGRLLFSKTLAAGKSSNAPPASIKRSAAFLKFLLVLYTHLALLLVAFAPPYLPIASALILPARFRQTTGASNVLRAWVLTLPMLALNGVLEALVASTAAPVTLRKQSAWMAFCSLVFVGCAALFQSQGLASGGEEIVWANAVAMALRAAWAARFARELLGPELIWRSVLPGPPVFIAFAIAGWIVRMWGNNQAVMPFGEQLRHVSVGILCLAACGIVCLVWERDTLMRALPVLAQRRRD
ncbi:Rft-1-domain-containing protein [Auriculariales sp. MPI-PUGE-AT-0066]|nr:Rft-1-domain-containing protein [Auriculariales sp. MPI-PUGE-AT-0066]